MGIEPNFVVAKSNRLRPDQWRLIGGGIAFPVLLGVMLAELMGYHGILIPLLAILVLPSAVFKCSRKPLPRCEICRWVSKC